MSRIRTIKPEFQQSESMGRVSRDARLLFIQLWTFADDAGRARAASRMLASVLFPFDEDAPDLIDVWLTELEREGCIVRYEIDGTHYIQVVNWLKHQRIDKATPSRIPPPTNSREHSLNIREQSEQDQRTKGPKDQRTTTESREREFAEFFAAYPHRVGEAEAMASYFEVRGAHGADVILAGLRRYVAAKPPDQRWLNPASFLARQRFLDRPAEPACGFSPSEAAASVPLGKVLVKRDSPSGNAWNAHLLKTTGKSMSVSEKTGGWYMPSEWPPGVSAGVSA